MLSSSPIDVVGSAARMAAQALVVDGAGEAAGQPHGGLLKGHDLEAVTTGTARRQPSLPHGYAAVNDQGESMLDAHGRSPSGVTYCRVGARAPAACLRVF